MQRSVNLSPVSYDAWLRLVFDHDVPDADKEEEAQYSANEWYWNKEFHTSNPARLLAHFSRLCREWNKATEPYTLEQTNQGVWFLLGSNVKMGALLADVDIPIEARLSCVHAMLRPYADFVAVSPVQEMENCFDMWWDMLCGHFWSAHCNRLKYDEMDAAVEEMKSDAESELSLRVAQFWADLSFETSFDEQLQEHGLSREEVQSPLSQIEVSYHELEPSEKLVADAMLETLVAIVTLEDERCQEYALHGLGHLAHPSVRQAVQKFIDENSGNWDEETLAWVERCRDGTVM